MHARGLDGPPPYSTANLIAVFMLQRALVHGDGLLRPFQINKLVYIAHGWALGALDRALIDNSQDQIQALMSGPTVISLNRLLSPLRNNAINLYAFYDLLAKRSRATLYSILSNPRWLQPQKLVDMDKEHPDLVQGLEWVFDTHAKYTDAHLAYITTEEHEPWDKCYYPGILERWGLLDSPVGTHIPDDEIKAHYRWLMSR